MTRTRLNICLALVTAIVAGTDFRGARLTAQDGTSSAEKRWIVLFHQQSALPSNANTLVAVAGGSVVALLPEVGAVLASSSNPTFGMEIASAAGVSDVVEDVPLRMIPPIAQLRAQDAGDLAAAGAGPVEPPGSDAQTGSEPFYLFQWDKKRMRASNQGSYAIEQGRPDVVVAVLDTGAEVTPLLHPDIVPNLDFGRSRSFVPVSPSPDGNPDPAAWDDKHGHGSWSLSAVGAPINGIGISGVAPHVTLVALKVLRDDGTGSPVSVAQGLIYAGVNKFDVASMSFAGYLPRSNQGGHAAIQLIQRAVNFARSNGVTPVAAMSNESFDVSDGSFFRDFLVVPAELAGVIGVSATGYFNLKASYSNYGVGKVDVAAPGGDTFVQIPPPPSVGLGGVLGAWAPDNPELPGAVYVFASGTSMATANAAGVVGLIVSRYGDFTADNSKKPHMSPQAVESILQQTANNQPCPQPREVTYFYPSPPFPPNMQVEDTLADQRCDGNAGHNGFFGKGIVDALKAVTR